LRARRRLLSLGLCGSARLSARLDGLDDRVGDLGRRSLAEPGSCEQLLGTLLSPGEDGRSLGASPFQRLLDLGTGRVCELSRLVPGLFEQSRAACLGLTQLLARLTRRLGDELPRLVPRRGQDLDPLPLAFVAEALNRGVALLEVELLLPYLLLGALNLGGGCFLRIPLEDIGKFRGLADEVERIHANGVAGRIDLRRATGGLEDAELGLELDGVPAEGLERVAHSLLVETTDDDDELFDARQRRDYRRLARCSWSLYRHAVLLPMDTARKYAACIGRRPGGP
jgi:hypothetical protein